MNMNLNEIFIKCIHQFYYIKLIKFSKKIFNLYIYHNILHNLLFFSSKLLYYINYNYFY